MIRNVCIHLSNEQPLLADLFDIPSAADAGLLCTNLRSMDGKRPVFVDNVRATFFFPYHVVRFLEIPEGAMAGHHVSGGRADGAFDPESDVVATPEPGSRLPMVVSAPDQDDLDEPDVELEIDEDFLQRIRDI